MAGSAAHHHFDRRCGARDWKRVARSTFVAAAVLLGGVRCLPAARGAEPKMIGAGVRVLFIGNSYTYVNDVPGLVQALADSAHGDSIAVETVAFADFALVDHWNDGTALREIRKGGWCWVVLQQGPSSLDVNRDTLRLWTKAFAREIQSVGARPVLFSAWPQANRVQDFDRAVASYSLAAADVNGLLAPVASAWLAAWRRDSTLHLYANDGLHASPEGSYLAALAIYGAVLGRTPLGLPNAIATRSGSVLTLEPVRARLLQDAASEALGR
jgi:hypothetical protein